MFRYNSEVPKRGFLGYIRIYLDVKLIFTRDILKVGVFFANTTPPSLPEWLLKGVCMLFFDLLQKAMD